MPFTALLVVLASAAAMLFELWPLSLVACLAWRGNLLHKLLAVWAFWVSVRLLSFLSPSLPVPLSLLIPEPASTIALCALGPALGLACLEEAYRKRYAARNRLGRANTAKDLRQVSAGEFVNLVAE